MFIWHLQQCKRFFICKKGEVLGWISGNAQALDLIYQEITSTYNLDVQCEILMTALVVSLLMILDIVLRLIIEARNFNIATHRENTVFSVTWSILFRAWRTVKVKDCYKRYLISKNLRKATMAKCHQYPFVVFLGMLFLLLPHVELFGIVVDNFLFNICLIAPVLMEITSIIESLQELDDSNLALIHLVQNFFKRFWGA